MGKESTAPKKKRYVVLTKDEAERIGRPGWSSRGYIPHYDAAGQTQHVTFRLADSLPEDVLAKWEEDLRILPEGEAKRQKYALVEQYLDAGHGQCYLGIPQIAEIVQKAVLHFAGERYDLHAWCVMPNHVHTLFTPGPNWEWSKILHSWKSFTANQCNQWLGLSGQFWQRDPFDRYIRDQNHFDKTLRYIENNPVNAGLCSQAEDWSWSSAYWRKQREQEQD